MNLFKKTAKSIASIGTTSSPPSPLPLSTGHDSFHEVIPHLAQPHRMFLIPEILENILCILSPYTLKYRVSPVCRLWRELSLRYLSLPPVTALWSLPLSNKEDETIFKDELFICQCLHLKPQFIFYLYQSTEGRDKVWSRLEDAVVMQSQTNKSFRITQLIVEGDLPIATRVEPLLAKAPLLVTMLTTIRIKKYQVGPVLFIDNILDTCTNLINLHLESVERLLPAWARFDPLPLGLREDSDYWMDKTKRPLKLQKLTLERWRISQRVMEALLPCCPSLKSLAITSAYGTEIFQQGGGGGVLIDTPFQLSPLYSLIARCFPSLEDIHVSFVEHAMQPSDAVVFRRVFYKVRSWTFSTGDIISSGLEPLIMPTLSVHSLSHVTFPILTSLQIQNGPFGFELSDSFHAYLVSPAAACLVHLRAKGIYYPYSSLINQQELWTCRRLETLHLNVNNLWIDRDARSSRVILGCLTQLLPRVRDLWLRYKRFHFGLEGGLCLLKRMRNLEKVHILSDSRHRFSKWDLHWLIRCPTRIQRFKRRLWVANLRRRSEYRQEFALKDVQVQTEPVDGSEPRRSSIGSLKDLVECLKGDCDGGGSPDSQGPVDCLPCLESLVIEAMSPRRNARKASMIQSMRLLRPDCEFRMIGYF